MLGRKLGSLLTGGGVGVRAHASRRAWSVHRAVVCAAVSLLSGGFRGGRAGRAGARRHWRARGQRRLGRLGRRRGGGWSAAARGGGFSSGGGGDFGGGGASGDW
jgi:uncharacterized protein